MDVSCQISFVLFFNYKSVSGAKFLLASAERKAVYIHSGTPLIRIKCDSEPSGYAQNPDNWIFVFENGLQCPFEVQLLLFTVRGTAVAQWLRRCATNR